MQPTRVKEEDHVTAQVRLQQEQALRVAELTRKTALLGMQPPNETGVRGALALSEAAMSRTIALQSKWAQGWFDLMDYAQTVQGADTVSKYSERVGNIALRAEAQVTTQVTDTLDLIDNVAVSYGYWLNQQLGD